MLTVLLGGARSGKSSLAERLASEAGTSVTYLATCPRIDGDDELAARIEHHAAARPPKWSTIEEERDLADAISRAGDSTLIVDCLTTWVSTLLHDGLTELDVLSASEAAIEVTRTRTLHTIVVSNEVGLGIVPIDAGVREYRDALGRVHQQWVSVADRALLMVAGRAIELQHPEDLL